MAGDLRDEAAKLLSSDELGEKGEAKFHDLCSDVGLIANKALRDRAGWDFIVQAPLEGQDSKSLDSRACLWTAYVQVKATWRAKRAKVRLRLSAAELLAKQLDPAFVIALAFDRNDLASFDLYALEFSGEYLESVLRALRKAHRDGNRMVNDRYIELPLRISDRITAATGEALKQRLAATQLNGAKTYIQSKARELESLGNTRVEGTIKFHGLQPDDLPDVLLGNRPCEATISDMVETRFGIDLPAPDFPVGQGLIHLQPKSVGRCEIIAHSKALTKPLRFEGDLYHVSVPGPEGLIWKSKLDMGLFAVERTPRNVTLRTTASDENDRPLPFDKVLNFYRLISALRNGKTKYEARSNLYGKPVEWEFLPSPDKIPEEVPVRLRILEAFNDICTETGFCAGDILVGELFERHHGVLSAWGFGKKRREVVSVSLPAREGEGYTLGITRETLFVDLLDIFGERFVFASVVRFKLVEDAGKQRWQSFYVRPVELRRLGFAEQQFREFVDAVKRRTRVDSVLLGDKHQAFYEAALGEIGVF